MQLSTWLLWVPLWAGCKWMWNSTLLAWRKLFQQAWRLPVCLRSWLYRYSTSAACCISKQRSILRVGSCTILRVTIFKKKRVAAPSKMGKGGHTDIGRQINVFPSDTWICILLSTSGPYLRHVWFIGFLPIQIFSWITLKERLHSAEQKSILCEFSQEKNNY